VEAKTASTPPRTFMKGAKPLAQQKESKVIPIFIPFKYFRLRPSKAPLYLFPSKKELKTRTLPYL
jgi:hypothetical protein